MEGDSVCGYWKPQIMKSADFQSPSLLQTQPEPCSGLCLGKTMCCFVQFLWGSEWCLQQFVDNLQFYQKLSQYHSQYNSGEAVWGGVQYLICWKSFSEASRRDQNEVPAACGRSAGEVIREFSFLWCKTMDAKSADRGHTCTKFYQKWTVPTLNKITFLSTFLYMLYCNISLWHSSSGLNSKDTKCEYAKNKYFAWWKC